MLTSDSVTPAVPLRPSGRGGGAISVVVVTPFYNSERYLAECIDSVLAQTWADFKYLLVNNRSSDESLAIVRAYCARDSRIQIVETERHLPQRENFNFALGLVARGTDYCKLVLADDVLFPRSLELMIGVAESDPQVALVGSYYLKGKELAGAGLPYQSTIFPGSDICRRQLLEGLYVFGNPSAVLYRGSLLEERSPFYSTTALHDDTEACYEILMTHKFGFVHQVLSSLRVDPDSVTGQARAFNFQALDKLIVIIKYGRSYLSEPEYQQCLKAHERDYYRAYVRGLLAANRRAFIAYHRTGHRLISYRMRGPALFQAAARELASIVCNPLHSVLRLWSHWAGKR